MGLFDKIDNNMSVDAFKWLFKRTGHELFFRAILQVGTFH